MKFSFINNELKNLVFWSFHPKNTFNLFKFIFNKFYAFLNRKTSLPMTFYPNEVSNLIILKSNKILLDKWISTDPDKILKGPKRLRLATGYLLFERYPKWSMNFDDTEQFLSLHRWNWLLRAISDETERPSLEWGISLMRSWLKEMSPLPTGLASESYTLGERISNAIIFSRLLGENWSCLPNDIVDALKIMSNELQENLEYYGENLTGNHPLNNGRALYLFSKCYGTSNMEILSKSIISERLNKITTSDGFLREGSIHYHFLYTRWLFELHLASDEFNDLEMKNIISDFLENAINACEFYLISNQSGNYHLPTIGDVSPDCDPEWLIDIPKLWRLNKSLEIYDINKNLSGWASLWFNGINKVADSPLDLLGRNKFQAYPDSGWFRLDWKGWSSIWHTQVKNEQTHAIHSHQDFGSFVLYYDGHEVLIDIGRPNYDDQNLESHYTTTFSSHNTLKINNLGPMLSSADSLYPPLYREREFDVICEEINKNKMISIIHNGYDRMVRSCIKHKRTFYFTNESVEITDYITGKGKVNVNLCFQWSDQPNLKNSKFQIIRTQNGLHDINESFSLCSSDGISGWRYPSYGTQSPCVTQRVNLKGNLPLSLTHKILIKNK